MRLAQPPIGSVVSAKGGQRAQKEAADKAAADRDAKEREQRNAADRDAKAKQQSAPSQATPAESPPAATPATPEPAPAAPKSARRALPANAASAGPAGTFPSPSRAARRRRRGRRRPRSSAPRSAATGGAVRQELLGDLPEVLGRRAEVLGDQVDRRALGLAMPAGADDGGEGQAAGRDHQHVHQSIAEAALARASRGSFCRACLQSEVPRWLRPDARHPSPGQTSWFRWSRCVVPAYSRRKRPRRCSSGTTRSTNSSIAPGQ